MDREMARWGSVFLGKAPQEGEKVFFLYSYTGQGLAGESGKIPGETWRTGVAHFPWIFFSKSEKLHFDIAEVMPKELHHFCRLRIVRIEHSQPIKEIVILAAKVKEQRLFHCRKVRLDHAIRPQGNLHLIRNIDDLLVACFETFEGIRWHRFPFFAARLSPALLR